MCVGESARFARLPTQQLIHRLAALAPKLRPELLHRVIAAYGLEDCVELIAQATPAQLSHIFDLDLWRRARPGLDEQFDAARFGLWLEVLVEAGADVAAAKLAAMPLPQIVMALAQHVRVYDVAAVSSYETTDGATIDYSRPVRDRVGCEIGGFHVAAVREEAWDPIVTVLCALDADHPAEFIALMRAVRSRSHSLREADGFHDLLQDRDQMIFDAADERERRRQQRGFASAADSRAFLEMSRSGAGNGNPIARAYRQTLTIETDDDQSADLVAPEEVQAIALLEDEGVFTVSAPRGLLGSGAEDTSTPLQRQLRTVFERDPAAYGDRHSELAYLANVLIAGCEVQERAFTPKDAADAAVATCNLGLERLSPHRDYLLAHDLIGVFQYGWRILHLEVCLEAATALSNALANVRIADPATQRALAMLRLRLLRELSLGSPWRIAGALDVLMEIDGAAWAALKGLIAECPVLHAGLSASLDRSIHSFDPHAFDWIADQQQLDKVREFTRALPRILNAEQFR